MQETNGPFGFRTEHPMNYRPKTGHEPVTGTQYLRAVAVVALLVGLLALARLCEDCVGDVTILRIEHKAPATVVGAHGESR